MAAGGYATDLVMEQVLAALVEAPDVTDKAKAATALAFAEADRRIADGADERTQLLDLFAKATKAMRG